MLENKKEVQVYKNKTLNSAEFANFTLNNYQVYINLIGKIGGVDDQGNFLSSKNLQREHILTAKEFSKNFNTDINHSYSTIKAAVNKLMKTDIRIERMVGEGYKRINVCSQAEYNEHKGSITVRFTEEIMPYLAQVTEQFTLYRIKEVSEFKSIYSFRLYELLQDFKDTGFLLISVETIRKKLGVGEKFKIYNNLKRKTFGHAIKEINSIYKMDLQVEEIKEGRKVATLKFTYNKTKIDGKRYNPKTGKHTNIYREIERQEVAKNKQTKDIVLEGQMEFEDVQDKNKLSSVLDNMFKA